MNVTLPFVIVAIGVGFLALEALFFLYCARWLSGGKKLREREFARLDTERNELEKLQQSVTRDLGTAKQLATETLNKLSRIGADAHAEWNEMTQKIDSVLTEIEKQTEALMQEHSALASRHRLALEKVCKESLEVNTTLQETLRNSKKVLKFFDKNVPADQIVKELQTEKYSEARRLLEQGMDASVVSRRLGMSQSEVILLANMR